MSVTWPLAPVFMALSCPTQQSSLIGASLWSVLSAAAGVTSYRLSQLRSLSPWSSSVTVKARPLQRSVTIPSPLRRLTSWNSSTTLTLIHSVQLLWPLEPHLFCCIFFSFSFLLECLLRGVFSKPSVYKYTPSFLKTSQNCCHLTTAYTLLIYLFVICLPLQCI